MELHFYGIPHKSIEQRENKYVTKANTATASKSISKLVLREIAAIKGNLVALNLSLL